MKRRANALLLFALTLGPLIGGRASAQGEEESGSTATADESATDDTIASDPSAVTEAEPSADEYQLPADLDEEYSLPADLDEEYSLPDDLDGESADEDGDDEWNFDAPDDEATPLVLPVFGETTFNFTSTTQAQYRVQNFNANRFDDNFLSFWEKFEFGMQGEHLRLGMRLDAFLPLLTSDCPDGQETLCFYNADLRLERFSLHYERGDIAIDAVDSYAVLGRGIALALRRVDLLGVDTTLRGGQVAYDEGRVFARLLGGAVNPQNLDPQTLRIVTAPQDRLRRDLFSNPERRDFLMGGEAGFRVAGVSLGAHAMTSWLGEQPGFERRYLSVLGWRLDAPALLDGKLSFYGEINALRRVSEPEFGEEEVETGYALYGSAQTRLGNLALLLEWKDYHNYRVAASNGEGAAHRTYSAPPTLERSDERPEALHNNRGGRLQMDYGFLPGAWSLSVTGLVYGFAENEAIDPFDGILVTHGFAKVQRVPQSGERIGWSFSLEAGFRRESYLEPDPIFNDVVVNGEYATVYHATAEAGIVLGDHSLELLISHRDERRHEAFDYVEFIRGQATLTYSFAGKLRVSPILAWNTQTVGADSPSLYPGLEVRYDFLSGSFVRVYGGQTPGGLLCSGGVCRDVPPFQGGTVELVLRL
ncbi:MAG: hypothetical protein ACI9KE_005427 [Polyangiales bacterium]|jgi:hypothetical protein